MTSSLCVSAIGLTSPLLPAVKLLGRKHSGTLGFFPDGAFEDHAARGHLLAASFGDTELAGYCAFRVSKGRAMIAHLCVAESHRGAGVAKKLFAALKTHAQERDLCGIGLHCRRDYPATDLWPKLGFVPVKNKPGRGIDGAELTLWWHALPAADLFSQQDTSEQRLAVVIECNVFRDLHDTTEKRNEQAQYLAADWLAAHIELCAVQELLVELNRIPLPLPREALMRHAQRYRLLSSSTSRTDEIYAELKVVFGHAAPTQQQASDMRHVALSASAEADVLLTRDKEILSYAAEIGERYGLQVMEPVDLISRLNEAEQAALYQPARFASTDIQKARPRPEELDGLAEKLHVPSLRETRAQFAAKLGALLCNRDTAVIAAQGDGAPLFLIAHRQTATRCEIPVLRCIRTALAATALRHALLQITADTAKLGGGPIVVRDSLLSEEVQSILHELGFRIGADGWEKITLRFLGDAFALAAALKSMGQPAIPDSVPRTEIEARFWPAKILGAGMETWAVPIRATWATALFETTFADEQLFRPKRELILSRENVYYSAAIQSGMEDATGRLLWYVSKDAHQPGSQSIRACSRLLEVRRGPAKVLFNEFRRLGVFEWRDILAIAGDDPTKEILALRFADTELFGYSFPGAEAKALGVLNNFTSPVKVPETAFAEIYRRGMKLPVLP
ncbi:MAG: GNAT family N-acetyltransferase [Verrucomicrobia bacterium]|nr:GNAT family N-acetyltransferase [Verrucomicrobiota bacterium]